MLTIFKLNNKVKGPHNEVSFLLVVKELTYFKCVTIIVTKQLSLIAVINIFSIIVTVVVTIKINHKTTKNVKTLNSNKRKETGMLKRFKFYMISGIVLVLLIVCNFVDKPIAKVGEVKDTVMMKLHTKESMAQIDGQTIYFKKIGEGKPPLLMLHGFGGSSDGFSDIYPELARDHTIIAVDILGFGRSSKPIDFEYSFPAQVNLYYKLMKKLGYDQFAVLGHSMGGEMSLNLAYLYPDAVTHLILADSTGIESFQQKKVMKCRHYRQTYKR